MPLKEKEDLEITTADNPIQCPECKFMGIGNYIMKNH